MFDIDSSLSTSREYSETQIVALNSPGQTAANLNSAIFRNAAAEGFVSKAASLFPGIGFGAAHKILQRVYKFGGQPVVLDMMTTRYGADFDERFGHKTGRTLLSATSGSLIGIGESECSMTLRRSMCFAFVFIAPRKSRTH